MNFNIYFGAKITKTHAHSDYQKAPRMCALMFKKNYLLTVIKNKFIL